MSAPRKTRPGRPGTQSPSLTSIGFMLHMAQSRLYAGVTAALEGSGLHAGQLAVLGVLSDKGEMSQRQLGEEARIEKSSLVLFLDHLENNGWVKRTDNPQDRRSYTVRLTARGSEKYRKLGPAMLAVQEEFLAPLSPQERIRLTDMLERLAQKK